jgi:hypothetical protein
MRNQAVREMNHDIITQKPKWNGESVTMIQLLRSHVERTAFCVINLVNRHFIKYLLGRLFVSSVVFRDGRAN